MTPRSRRVLTVAALLVPVIVALLAWQQTRPPGFADSRLVLVDGRTLHGRDLQGAPVLLNFWATTCPVCIAEMPDLAELHQEYADRGVTVLAVAMPYDPPDQVVAFTQQRQLPFAVSFDIEHEITLSFGLSRVTPVNILLDQNGRERWRQVGRLSVVQAKQHIERLLEES